MKQEIPLKQEAGFRDNSALRTEKESMRISEYDQMRMARGDE
jgi:hypothetical protein